MPENDRRKPQVRDVESDTTGNGWAETVLSDALHLDISTVAVSPADTYEIVGVLNRGRGLLHRDPIKGSQTTYKTLNRIRPDQVVYSRLKAFEGAITVVPTDAPVAYASQEFPTFSCRTNLLPDYFRLVTTTPLLWSRLQSLSIGMGGRRERVKPTAFLSISLPLPPVPVQRRIVEVMSAIDDQIAALDKEVSTGAGARAGVIDSLIAEHATGESAILDAMGRFERGRRFTKKDYAESGLGCIHYGQIYTDYGAVATETVSFLPESFRPAMRLAHPGDLVIAGTGENAEDIGKAVTWLGSDDVAVHDDAYIFRHTLDPAYASALFASTVFLSQRIPSDSKVARLSAQDLAAIEVPVVEHEAQVQVGEAMMAFDASLTATRAEADRLRAVRAVLLAGLMSREIEIAGVSEVAA